MSEYSFLSDKQKFAILRQSPEFIGYDKLELVYLIAYLLHLRSHSVVVGNSLKMFVLYLIGNLACVDQFFHTTLNNLSAFSYLFNYLLVA